jgi:hypothetical protein
VASGTDSDGLFFWDATLVQLPVETCLVRYWRRAFRMSGLDAPPVRTVSGREGPEAVSAVSNAGVEGEAHPANTDMASSIHVPVIILFITSLGRRAEVCCAGSCKLVVKALQHRQAVTAPATSMSLPNTGVSKRLARYVFARHRSTQRKSPTTSRMKRP